MPTLGPMEASRPFEPGVLWPARSGLTDTIVLMTSSIPHFRLGAALEMLSFVEHPAAWLASIFSPMHFWAAGNAGAIGACPSRAKRLDSWAHVTWFCKNNPSGQCPWISLAKRLSLVLGSRQS